MMKIFIIILFILYVPFVVFSQVESVFGESDFYSPYSYFKVNDSIYFNHVRYESTVPNGLYRFSHNGSFPTTKELILDVHDVFPEPNDPEEFNSLVKVDNYIYYNFSSSISSGFSRFNVMNPFNSNEVIFEAENGIHLTTTSSFTILSDTLYFNYVDNEYDSHVGKIDLNSSDNIVFEENSVSFMLKMKSLNNNTILYLKDVDPANFTEHYAIYQFDPNNTVEPHQEFFNNESYDIRSFDVVDMNVYFVIFNEECFQNNGDYCGELYSINLNQTPHSVELISFIPSNGFYSFSIIDNYMYFSEIIDVPNNEFEMKRFNLSNPILNIDNYGMPNNGKMVFPNPANEFIKISNILNLTDYEIFNVQGYKVLSGRYNANQSIDIKELKSGIYFIKINDKTLKFIID